MNINDDQPLFWLQRFVLYYLPAAANPSTKSPLTAAHKSWLEDRSKAGDTAATAVLKGNPEPNDSWRKAEKQYDWQQLAKQYQSRALDSKIEQWESQYGQLIESQLDNNLRLTKILNHHLKLLEKDLLSEGKHFTNPLAKIRDFATTLNVLSNVTARSRELTNSLNSQVIPQE